MREKSPCLGCKDRVADPNCHTTCEIFLDWETRHTLEREDIRQKKIEDAAARKIQKDGVYKALKKRRGGH